MSQKIGLPLAGLSVIAAVVMGAIYVYAMKDIYYQPDFDGQKETFFRKMVGINDQPVRAMKFFDANKITGVVLNEWTNGGYVAYGQEPREDNGCPPCKVYMDGRAQAAYRVSHFTHYNRMKPFLPETNPNAVMSLNQLARSQNISLRTTADYEKLVENAQKDRMLLSKLRSLAMGVPELFVAVKEYRNSLDQMIAQFKLKRTDSDMYEKLIKEVRDLDSRRSKPTDEPDQRNKIYYQLVQMSNADPDLYGAILRHEGLNVALLSRSKSASATQINLLTRAKDWQMIYWDNRNIIFADKDALQNEHLFGNFGKNLKYPDDFSHNLNVGRALCLSSSPAELKEGLKLLQSIEYPYAYHGYDWIKRTGFRFKPNNPVVNEIIDYFNSQRTALKKRVDSQDAFGRRINLISIATCCKNLSDFYARHNKKDLQKQYLIEFNQYNKMVSEFQLPSQEGWFW